jgi:hypothetical protein
MQDAVEPTAGPAPDPNPEPWLYAIHRQRKRSLSEYESEGRRTELRSALSTALYHKLKKDGTVFLGPVETYIYEILRHLVSVEQPSVDADVMRAYHVAYTGTYSKDPERAHRATDRMHELGEELLLSVLERLGRTEFTIASPTRGFVVCDMSVRDVSVRDMWSK